MYDSGNCALMDGVVEREIQKEDKEEEREEE